MGPVVSSVAVNLHVQVFERLFYILSDLHLGVELLGHEILCLIS